MAILPARGGPRLHRKRKIWISVWVTLLGTAGLAALAMQVESRRETDLADARRDITSVDASPAALGAPAIAFRDVAAEMGILMRHGPGPRGRALPEDTGSGVAWGDVDGDGDSDLYFVNFSGPLRGARDAGTGGNRLFRNDGARFTDVTARAGVGDADGFGMGASFADYDGDGDLDLYVTNYGPDRLYRNRGDGTFQDVTRRAGVSETLWSTGACWGDFDRDGLLDLYVCNYVRYDDGGMGPELMMPSRGGQYSVPFTLNPNSFDPVPNRLYRNRGDGSFEDVAERCGVANPEGRSLAATFVDLDGDGWLDLYVNNDVSENKLYRNMLGEGGPGRASLVPFADLSAMTGTGDPRASMGLSVGEIGWMTGDPDGLPDLFLTHWVAQENAFYQSLRMPAGGLEYRDKSRQLGLAEISIDKVGWGSALVDLDLDGRIDVAVANGSTLERKDDPLLLLPEPMFFFWNDGKRFHDLAAHAGEATAREYVGRGLAACDFDRDGDVDLAMSVNRGEPVLLRNDTRTANRSLVLELDGPDAARFGARVEVTVAGTAQLRWWGADVSFLGNHAAEMVFGLGTAAAAERVQVRWADGQETTLTGVPAGRVQVPHPGRGTAAATKRV